MHRKKAFRYIFPAGMPLTKLSLIGNNDVIYKLFPPRESLVSDIPAGDGNIEKLFLQCTVLQKVALDCLSYHATANDEDAIWLSKEIIPKVS